jgi:hypothetical protein
MSVSDAPFWAWWLVPVGITTVVAVGVAVAHHEWRPRRHENALDDGYLQFRRAMARLRAGRGPR